MIQTTDLTSRVLAERGHEGGSWPWTLRFLQAADEEFGGLWREVTLPAEEAAAVRLPEHRGEPCRGDRLALVDRGGASVAEVARRLTEQAESYARLNPECWSRIARAREAPLSTIVLVPAPLDIADHDSLRGGAGRLFHVDGFHRLVGWALVGRLQAGQPAIRAFVAGRATPGA